jgi:broad specificity phosphatase PhoE
MTIVPPEQPTTLYLIRHGEVEECYHRIFGGSRIDMGLSQHGHAQASRLAHWLAQREIHEVYASPMKRVQETMAPYLLQCQHEPTVHEGLREMDFGTWTGHGWDDIEQKFGVSAYDWLDIIHAGELPEGETGSDIYARVGPALQQILSQSAGRSSAIFCHGGIVRVMLAQLLQVPLPKMNSVEIDYASVTQVRFRPHPRHPLLIESLNFCPWRENV